ncbi:MAG: T9SS type A sorting domain-containing protein [Saprospiraceae bacterium]|nr:T9SS type A sorting domain-containing protein [Saprospiraceae bacterium]
MFGKFRVIEDDVYYQAYYEGEILKATNTNLTAWDTVFAPAYDYQRIHSFDVFGDEIFLCGYGNLTYRSLDDGTSWEVKSYGMEAEGFYYDSFIKAGNDLLAISNSDYAVFRSSDNGLNWSFYVNPSLFDAVAQANPDEGILWFLHHNDKLFAVVNTIGSTKQLIRSDDEGATWHLLPSALFNNFAPPRSYGNRIISYNGFTHFIASNDDGDTWYNIQPPLGLVFDYVMSGDSMVALTYNTTTQSYDITYSHDLGVTWHSQGFLNMKLDQLDLYNGKVIASGESGVFVSLDLGATWQQTGQAFPHVIQTPPPNEYFASYGMDDGLLLMSHSVDHPSVLPVPGDFVHMLVTADDGTNWDLLEVPVYANYYFENDGYFFAADPHTIWRVATSDIQAAIILANADSLTIDTAVCTGQTVGGVLILSDTSIIVTLAGMDTAVVYNITALQSDTTSTTIELCQHEASPLTGTVYDDAGEFAEQQILTNQFGCDSLVMAEVIVHPEEFGEGWAMVPYGYVALDGTVVTEPYWQVTYDTTQFGCLFTLAIQLIPSPNATNELENAIALRVFPNPTSNEFYVEVPLLGATPLHIQVLDPLGRLVAKIAEGEFYPPGKNVLRVDVLNWPAGVYTIHLQADGSIVFRKLIKS